MDPLNARHEEQGEDDSIMLQAIRERLNNDGYTQIEMRIDLKKLSAFRTQRSSLMRCEILLKLKQFQEVIDLATSTRGSGLATTLDKDQRAMVNYLIGMALFGQNKNDAAQKTLMKNEDHFDSLFLIAQTTLAGKKFAIARQFLEKANKLFPENMETLLLLGDLEKQTFSWDASLLYYQEYIRLFPSKSKNVLLSIAEIQLQLKNFTLALEYIQKYTASQPESHKTHYLSAQAYIELTLYNQAELSVGEALLILPNDPFTLFLSAKCDFHFKKYSESKAKMNLCVKFEPFNLEYIVFLALTMEAEGQQKEAEEIYLRCIKINLYFQLPYYRLAEYYYKQKDCMDKAQIYLEKIISFKDQNINETLKYVHLLLLVYINQKNKKNLEFLSETKRQNIQSSIEIVSLLASTYLDHPTLKNRGLAKFYLQRIVEMYATGTKDQLSIRIIALKNLAKISFASSEFLVASQFLKELKSNFQEYLVVDEKQSLFDIYYMLAMIEIKKQDCKFPSVKKNLEKCLRVNPNSAYVFAAFALYYHQNKDNRKAKQYLSLTFSKDQNLPLAFYLRARITLFENIDEDRDLSFGMSVPIPDDSSKEKLQQCCQDLQNCELRQSAIKFLNALLLFQQGELIKAQVQFGEIIDSQKYSYDDIYIFPFLDTDLFMASYYKAKISYLLKSNKLDSEIIYLMKLKSTSLLGLQLQARVLYENSNIGQAKDNAFEAISINSSLPFMHFIIAQDYMQKSFSPAIPHLLMIRALNPTFPRIYHILSDAFEYSSQYEEALNIQFKMINFSEEINSIKYILKCVSLMKKLHLYIEALEFIQKYEDFLSYSTSSLNQAKDSIYLILKNREQQAEFIARQPDSIISLLEITHIHHKEKQFAQEVQNYMNFIDKNEQKCSPQQLNVVYNQMGIAHLLSGFYTLAASNFKQASILENKQNASFFINNIVITFIKAGDLTEAKDSLKLSLKTNPSNTETIFLQGLVSSLEGDQVLAIEYYKKLLEIDSCHAPAAINCATLLKKNKQFDEAIAVLIPSSEFYEQNSVLKYHLALCYLEMNKPEKVIEIAMKLLAIIQEGKRNVLQWEYFSTRLPSQLYKQNIDVISYKQRGMEHPDKVMVNLLISRALRMQRKTEQELKHLEKCLKMEPINSDYIFNYATSLMIAGKFKQAIEKLKDCLKYNPNSAALYHTQLANVYHSLGLPEQEINCLEESIRASPNFTAYDNIGAAQFKNKYFNNAKEAYLNSISLSPNRADPHYNLGNVYLAQRNFDHAINSYNSALIFDPTHLLANNNLGFVWMLKQNYIKAINCYEKCIEIDPKNIQKYNEKLTLLTHLLFTSSIN